MKILVLGILLVLAISGCGHDEKTWPTRSFDSTVWHHTPEGERYIFVKDLLNNQHLRGTSRSDIEKMLGKPSFVSNDGTYITYIVRVDSGLIYLLDVRFVPMPNGGHVVSKAFVRTD
ncbi:hypothetical protein GTP91_11220 [Rugamonas sp. FT82W]|uniref:Uncharacterized protein n=1 Tax=Duganella vulcania TaxID=2692166 RepID=A0A845G1L3_9BURK|nr:hypothetical protein [Duganella vulcania]MYM87751.1 hypothetical protein [Duganella vulcania]